jgi:hypothetical protein
MGLIAMAGIQSISSSCRRAWTDIRSRGIGRWVSRASDWVSASRWLHEQRPRRAICKKSGSKLPLVHGDIDFLDGLVMTKRFQISLLTMLQQHSSLRKIAAYLNQSSSLG